MGTAKSLVSGFSHRTARLVTVTCRTKSILRLQYLHWGVQEDVNEPENLKLAVLECLRADQEPLRNVRIAGIDKAERELVDIAPWEDSRVVEC